MDAELTRRINDNRYREEWAERTAASTTPEQLVQFVYAPNSTFLTNALQRRLRGLLGLSETAS